MEVIFTSFKARDYLFDNYKALLIILVIIGHFIQPCYDNNILLYTVKYVIYAFHMPAFIFISGYFSKKNTSWQKSFQKVLMPYFSFELIYYFYYNYCLGLNTDLNLAVPKFSLWYLLALFVWKIATPYVRCIPHYFGLSVVAGLAIGFLPAGGKIFSISRIFVFYPYFLAGTLLDREKLTSLRTNLNRMIGISGISTFIMFVALFADKIGLKLDFFYGKSSYTKMGQDPFEGIVMRLFCYGIGFFFTYAIAILMKEEETIFSKLGIASMSVYLFHGLFFKFLEHKTEALTMVNGIPESILLLICCIALAFLFSWKPLCKFTNSFAALSLSKMSAWAERHYLSQIEYKFI